MAASELAQRAVRVAGVVASLSACWGALQPRPVVPSLPAGGDLRRMVQEGLVTLGCLSTELPASLWRTAPSPAAVASSQSRLRQRGSTSSSHPRLAKQYSPTFVRKSYVWVDKLFLFYFCSKGVKMAGGFQS